MKWYFCLRSRPRDLDVVRPFVYLFSTMLSKWPKWLEWYERLEWLEWLEWHKWPQLPLWPFWPFWPLRPLWPNDLMTWWQEASQTIDRMVYLLFVQDTSGTPLGSMRWKQFPMHIIYSSINTRWDSMPTKLRSSETWTLSAGLKVTVISRPWLVGSHTTRCTVVIQVDTNQNRQFIKLTFPSTFSSHVKIRLVCMVEIYFSSKATNLVTYQDWVYCVFALSLRTAHCTFFYVYEMVAVSRRQEKSMHKPSEFCCVSSLVEVSSCGLT